MQIETVQVFIINPIEVATLIEVVAAKYLKKELTLTINVKLTKENGITKIKEKTAPVITCPEPQYPSTGIEMLKIYIDKMLIDNSAWSRCKSENIMKLWEKFIVSEYKHTIEVYELIENLLMDLRIDISTFIGKDKWVMHFRNNSGTDIVIEKSIDYRIHSWMQEHGWEFKTTERP